MKKIILMAITFLMLLAFSATKELLLKRDNSDESLVQFAKKKLKV